MKSNITLNMPNSAALRRLLENHLYKVFANNAIGKYLTMDDCGTEFRPINSLSDNVLALPYIKMTYQAWIEMDAADRYAVLSKFHHLYAGLQVVNTGNRKTMIFCALFVHEFAAVLAEAMQWPD
ncbi:hypothetical protein [Mucilaginibacter sp. PPCGB 2223]|uniref:hypothetical protein n=1 Tax=Mucilaginibacter sp. PPCGB 2223 TaxID=1886027 RepID=UPI001112AFFC|nr:hypothetical protein [Mucilaginibacter sp. PPCGB 2223]